MQVQQRGEATAGPARAAVAQGANRGCGAGL